MDSREIMSGFIRGSISGIIAGIATHPFDLIKVRMQIDKKIRNNSITFTKNIIKNEGVNVLFKGLTATMLRQSSFIGVKFGCYELWKSNFKQQNKQLSFEMKLLGGCFSGIVTSIICNPFEVALVRTQIDGYNKNSQKYYTSGLNTVKRIINEEGFRTLWRGIYPTCLRSCIITSTQLGIYDEVKEQLVNLNYFENKLSIYTISSITCSIISGIVSHPIDIIKTRSIKSYDEKSIINYIKDVKNKEGLKGFTKGIKPAIIRQIPLNCIRFISIEYLKLII